MIKLTVLHFQIFVHCTPNQHNSTYAVWTPSSKIKQSLGHIFFFYDFTLGFLIFKARAVLCPPFPPPHCNNHNQCFCRYLTVHIYCIRFADDIQLRGAVNIFEGRIATQKDADRLEENAKGNPVKFKRAAVPYMGKSSLCYVGHFSSSDLNRTTALKPL